LSVFRLIRPALRARPDAFFAVEPESWVAALICKALTGKPVVFDVHEYIPSEFAKFFPRPTRAFMNWLTIKFMRLFARMTDQIVLTKSCLDREFTGLKVPRTVVLNTNHLQPECAEIDAELREKYAGKPVILHQGQFGDRRGSYQLLDAMKLVVKEIPDARCLLLGPYILGDEAAYQRAVEAAGLGDHIISLGTVRFEQVPQYIAIAKAGLILFQPVGLGHTLGMPHKMFDYMRESVPYIGPDFVIEIKRITEEADCGILVDVTDPAAIAAAILRLLRDPAEARRLGANGRRAVETKYNWQHDESELLRVFAALKRDRA
jgi:glycosyltransferase involved in cell wall biosynthesis